MILAVPIQTLPVVASLAMSYLLTLPIHSLAMSYLFMPHIHYTNISTCTPIIQ